jgi:hypothetical protein
MRSRDIIPAEMLQFTRGLTDEQSDYIALGALQPFGQGYEHLSFL